MLSTIVSQWLTELGKTDFYFTPPFRNCWYYSLLLISGNFFPQMLLFFVSPPLKHWRISAQTGDETRRDVQRHCIWSSWEQNLHMEQRKGFGRHPIVPFSKSGLQFHGLLQHYVFNDLRNLPSFILAVLWVRSCQHGCRICPLCWLGNLAGLQLVLFSHSPIIYCCLVE